MMGEECDVLTVTAYQDFVWYQILVMTEVREEEGFGK